MRECVIYDERDCDEGFRLRSARDCVVRGIRMCYTKKNEKMKKKIKLLQLCFVVRCDFFFHFSFCVVCVSVCNVVAVG